MACRKRRKRIFEQVVDTGKSRDKIRDPNDGKRNRIRRKSFQERGIGMLGKLTNAIANAVAGVSQETRKLFCRIVL